MNKDKRNNIKLLGTLNNSDESGIIANANQIYDANEDKSTQDVSKEHTERIKTLEDKENELIAAVGTGGSVDTRITNAVNVEKTRAEGAESTLDGKITAEQTRAANAENALDGRVDTLEEAVGTGGSVDSKIASAVATETSRAQEAEANRYTKNETYTKEEVNNLITTPNQEYVSVTATDQTTAVTDVLPATGAADRVYRVGNWDGSQYDAACYSEYAWNGSAYVHLGTKTQIGEVFDISAYHATGGTLATYDDINDALGTNGENIPQSLQKGGMSVKFVQSSDNKYVQYMLKTNSWSIYINDWERCNDITTSNQLDSDLDVSDGRGNVLVRFKDGHIKTKNFDSSKNATAEKNGLMSAEDKTKLNSIEEGANASGVKTEDIEHSDLDIPDLDVSDGRGNVLVRFKDGHIKTKNFDSKQITSLPLEGKSYSILGDSISTFQGYLRSDEAGYDGTTYAYWYPKTYLNDVNQTWWKKLEKLTGLTLLQNCAWSGSQVCGNSQSTTSAQAGCSTRRITDLAKNGVAPDIIIVLIGINDLRNSDSRALGDWNGNDEIVAESTNVATFSAAYSLMVSKIMTTYPNSEVFCCTILDTGHSGFDTHDNAKYPCMNDRGNTTKEWNDTIRMVSESLGANVLDMHACGIDFFNLDTYTGDRLHPNANGATLMAQKAARELISKSKLTVK